MKKAFLIIVAATTILAACTKTVAPVNGGDAAVGTYTGTINITPPDTTIATVCTVTKINNTLIKMTLSGSCGAGIDSVTINGTASPYSLAKTGVALNLTGTLNNNTLQWSFAGVSIYTFNGTK